VNELVFTTIGTVTIDASPRTVIAMLMSIKSRLVMNTMVTRYSAISM
jgi:hypothetical protein